MAAGTVDASLRGLGRLLSPVGLVSGATWLPSTEGDPAFHIYTSHLGNPGAVLDAQKDWIHDIRAGNFDGAGSSLDGATAAYLSIAESLERYSSCAWEPGSFLWSSAQDLGDEAIGPDQWPNCSKMELAHPECGLIPSDPRIPIRWVRGWSFTRRRVVYVPAVQVYLRCPPESSAERYTHTVSTGCAAHTDVESAIVNGILEVVERDSIALTWLQRMRLPRLHVDPEELTAEQRRHCSRPGGQNVRTLLFDATTDLGIPVIYGIHLADHDPTLAHMVVATCDPDIGQGIAKLYRESASLRVALRSLAAMGGGHGGDAGGVSVFGGALEAGSPNSRDRFDFLLDGDRPTHRMCDLPRPTPGSSTLAWLLQCLDQAGHEVIVVDITTDEARQVGATVVRVLIPQAMPLSFAHRARYLAHPRLYTAPAAMGMTVYPEQEINQHPQPFA